MGDTNYLASIVKILEKPIQTVINDKIITTEFRVQLAQVRNTRIVKLVFWGNLARDVVNYYHVNDYIMIEGYLSLHDKKNKLIKSKLKKVQITVLKVYPIKN
jgi:single-stranded DNA-binding protein